MATGAGVALAHIRDDGIWGCSDPDCWFCRGVAWQVECDVMGSEVAALPWDWPPRPPQSDPYAIDDPYAFADCDTVRVVRTGEILRVSYGPGNEARA